MKSSNNAAKNNAKKKILIVEDERAMTRALLRTLSRAGFYASVAFDGKEALAALAKEPFDLIILDLLMPTMDGFRFMEELKKQNNHTPIVVLTNLSQREELDRARALGAVHCFVKSNTPLQKLVLQTQKVLA